MDIGEWLGNLGLERYNAAFRENAIDTDVLRDLTDQDLEKLGVLLGDRRRLLRAIAALDDGSAAASSTNGKRSPRRRRRRRRSRSRHTRDRGGENRASDT